MNFKSHTRGEVARAIMQGQEVWALDTGNDGNDDVLIGSKQETIDCLLAHHELDELPGHWTLDPVTALNAESYGIEPPCEDTQVLDYISWRAMCQIQEIIDGRRPVRMWFDIREIHNQTDKDRRLGGRMAIGTVRRKDGTTFLFESPDRLVRLEGRAGFLYNRLDVHLPAHPPLGVSHNRDD